MSTDHESNILRIVRDEADRRELCLAYGVAKYLSHPDLLNMLPSKPEDKVKDIAASIIGAAKIHGAEQYGLKIFHDD